MTNPTAPQEDELRLPASWTKTLLPRRGRAAPEVVLDPQALPVHREKIRELEPKIRDNMRLEANLAWVDDVDAYLLGKSNPRGAAAVAVLMPYIGGHRNSAKLRPALEAWIAEFGLPFATAAAVERLALRVEKRSKGGDDFLVRDGFYPGSFLYEIATGVPFLRGLLAAAPDDEFAAVLAAVAPLRHEPARRMAVTLLLPEEERWNDEASADYGRHSNWNWDDRIVWSWVRTPAQVAAANLTTIRVGLVKPDGVAMVVDGLGAASFKVLTETLEVVQGRNNAKRHTLLTAIGALPTDEAMDYLLDHLNEADFFEATATAVGRFPVRALRRLARLASDVTPERQARLAGIAMLIDAEHLEHLDASERAAIEDLKASDAAVPEAAAANLPLLLTAPPWTRKGPKRKPVVIAGLEAPTETVMVWAPGERERWLELRHHYYGSRTAEQWDEIAAKAASHSYSPHWVIELTAYAPPDLAARHESQWNGKAGYGQTDVTLRRIIARFETEVADRAVRGIANTTKHIDAMGPIRSLAAARLAAEHLGRKSTRTAAAAWFDRHGANGAHLLIPDALGSGKALRSTAERALVYLRSAIGPDAVRDAAKPYGAEAFEAIGALMDTDPLEPLGVKVPKPGTWANASMLPQPLLAGLETALPAASVPHLVTVLALGTPEFPYAGVDVVAETCDPESLRRFSWALFEQWLSVGAPSKDGWALTQLVHFADDETVKRLTAMIREWPGQGQHKRAITGLRVLGVIGSESALRAIHGISQKVKFKALKEEAGRQIGAVAEGLGLTADQLADRLVPDFGLREKSALVLDYGPRQFKVGFDEALKPFVTDMEGKPRKALPKPGAKDDDVIAEAAYKRFAALKKDLRTVSSDLVARLESAMIQGRTWTLPEFRQYFTEHPLVQHLSRRLVWMFENDGRWAAFRVAEDRTFSDAEDDELDVPEDAAIRLAHPILLGDTASAWRGILLDYEILQPFDQLGRPVAGLEEGDLATGRLARFEGATVDVGRILGMTKRGWVRAEPADAGMEAGIFYEIADDAYLLVALDPGLYASAVDSIEDQTLERVWLAETDSFWRNEPGPESLERFANLDPIKLSEALTSLARLAKEQ